MLGFIHCCKCRQDLLKVHLRKIDDRVNNKAITGDELDEWSPEWFPPGIHYSCKTEKAEAKEDGGSLNEEGQMEWMTNNEISSKDLHRAMFNMSKLVGDILNRTILDRTFPGLLPWTLEDRVKSLRGKYPCQFI